jgi:competence protein ComFC
MMRWISSTTLDLVYPPICVGCGRVDTWLCHACETDQGAFLPVIPFADDDLIDGMAALGTHSGMLRDSVHALKFHNARRLAQPLSRQLARILAITGWQIDVIMPVPLAPKRMKSRGYNQAALLAESLAHICDLPYADLLMRVRETETQVGQDADSRRENLAGAFACVDERVQGCSVLLIDDVTTTGATLEACAVALRQSQARQVFSLTVTAAAARSDG